MLGDQLGHRQPADVQLAVDLVRGRATTGAATSALGSAGALQPGRAAQRSGRVRPAGLVATSRHIRSGAETPSRPRPLASTVRAARDQHQPRLVEGGDRLVALRQHPALLGVVPPVEDRGGVLEVAGHPVRLAQLGGAGDHPRELGQRPQQLALLLVGEQRRVEPGREVAAATCRGRPRWPSSGRCGRGRTARSRPGCRWTGSPTGRGRGRCWSRSCSASGRSARRRRRSPRPGRRW